MRRPSKINQTSKQQRLGRLISSVGTSSTIILVASLHPQNALALPFRTNPASFASYANSLQWEGERVRFSNLYGCSYWKSKDTSVRSARAKHASEQQVAWGEKVDRIKQQLAERGASWEYIENNSSEVNEARNNMEIWSNLAKRYDEEDAPRVEHYSCRGYVQISDPHGTRVCNAGLTFQSDSGVRYNANQCVWR